MKERFDGRPMVSEEGCRVDDAYLGGDAVGGKAWSVDRRNKDAGRGSRPVDEAATPGYIKTCHRCHVSLPLLAIGPKDFHWLIAVKFDLRMGWLGLFAAVQNRLLSISCGSLKRSSSNNYQNSVGLTRCSAT